VRREKGVIKMSEEITDADLLTLVEEDIIKKPPEKAPEKVEEPKVEPKPVTLEINEKEIKSFIELTDRELEEEKSKSQSELLELELGKEKKVEPSVTLSEITEKPRTAEEVAGEALEAIKIKKIEEKEIEVKLGVKEEEEFDLSPAEVGESIAIVVVGDKASGKTTFVLNPKYFSGKIAAITMDEMTQHIWSEIYKKDPRIVIYDGLRYYNPATSEEIVDSASRSLLYLSKLLVKEISPKKFDWILWDCSEELQEICEMAMRKDAGFKAKDGVPWQYWRLRNMHMDNLFNKSLKVAKKGIIFTLYTIYRDIKESGEIMYTKKDIKWAGNLKTQSLVIIETLKKVTSDGKKYYMNVESSKVPSRFKETDTLIDVTVKY